MTDNIAYASLIAIAAVVFIGWLVAEFRARTVARLALALLSMLLIWYSVALPSAWRRFTLATHTACLCHLKAVLDEGGELEARKALQVYCETYEKTRDPGKAVSRMDSVLAGYTPPK